MPSATPSRRICSARAPTCVPSRSSSGTRASPPRSATRTSTSGGSWRRMTARIREPDGRIRPRIRSTTILSVRHGGKIVMAGDGQVTVGQTVMKRNARKVRRLYHDRVLAGFAGAGADALTLFERFEKKLGEVNGNLRRAAVELAKDWRTDRLLRRLEA